MNQDKRAPEEILARARRAWTPSAADAERVRRAASVALGAGVVPKPAAPASSWAAKLCTAGLIASVSGGAGYWAGHRAGVRAARPPAPVSSPAQPAAPVVPPAPNSSPAAAGAQPFALPPIAAHGDRHGARRGTGAEPPVAAESLAIEVRALRNAERALRDGAPGLALAFLRELDRQVPHGRLTEERDAAATLARCTRGDRPFGVDLAADFVERYPNSVYRARVEQACAATDSPAPGDSSARRSDE